MSRIATLAGPGTLRAPVSHCCTARTVHSSAAASWAGVIPSRSRAARTSAGDMDNHSAVAGAMGAHDLDAIPQHAMGILRAVGDQFPLGQRGVGLALAPQFPTISPVHLDPQRCHGNLLGTHNVRRSGCGVKNIVRSIAGAA